MKKLIFVYLALGVVFAKDKVIGIFDNCFNKKMIESLQPSFDCGKAKNGIKKIYVFL